MIDPHSYDAAYIAGYFEQWVDHVKAGKNTVPTTQLDVEMLEKAIVLLRGPSPLSRSAAAFPADYRKALEASNLPIEVATAIADRLDARDGTNAGDTPISDSFLRHADRISEALYAPCQYAEDVGMPEYRCSVECQYAPSAEFEECAAALLDFAPHTMDRSVRFRMEQAARLLRQRGPSWPSEPTDAMLERMIVAWFEDVDRTSLRKEDCPEFYNPGRVEEALMNQPPSRNVPSKDVTSLRNAASALMLAAEMLEHNERIFHGKWKKGSKAWSGDHIERTIADGLAHIGASSAPSETPAQSRNDAAIGPRTLAAIAEGEALISPLDERARRFGQKRETYKEFATRIALLAVEELSACKVHGAECVSPRECGVVSETQTQEPDILEIGMERYRAGWNAAMEVAAQACEERQGEGHDDGVGPAMCADKIRTLKVAQ
jgi:hypothetical protein